MARDTRESLAMLTPRGIGELDMPRGGIPDLTCMDVAAAMGMGLDRLGAELLMVKYADDLGHLKDLRTSWFMHVMSEKSSQKWESPKPGMFKNMADVTLAEYLSLNLCPACKGRKEVPHFKTFIECKRCEGSGRQYPTNYTIAREIGVGSREYSESWSDRVQWCRDELESKERVAIAVLWGNLR